MASIFHPVRRHKERQQELLAERSAEVMGVLEASPGPLHYTELPYYDSQNDGPVFAALEYLYDGQRIARLHRWSDPAVVGWAFTTKQMGVPFNIFTDLEAYRSTVPNLGISLPDEFRPIPDEDRLLLKLQRLGAAGASVLDLYTPIERIGSVGPITKVPDTIVEIVSPSADATLGMQPTTADFMRQSPRH